MSHLTAFDRAGRITASMAGAILLHDPTHSQKWAWRVITEREPEHDDFTGDLARGNEHEPDAVEAAEIELGVIVHEGRFVPHPTLDWLGASPDGFILEPVEQAGKVAVVEFEIPVECKCPRIIHEGVPLHYYDQVQCQLECCDAPYGYFVSWTEDAQRVKKIPRDPKWWAESFPLLKQFYEEYVLKDIEPPKAKRGSKVTGYADMSHLGV